MISYSPKEIIGKDFRNYLDKDSKELVADNYKRRQKGEPVPSEYSFGIITKSGAKKTVQISSAITKDKDGKIKTVAQILDITDKVHAKNRLIESERRYRTLFETAGDSIFIMENDLFIDCNERTLELFNWAAAV